MKNLLNNIVKGGVLLSAFLMTSCFSELDQKPENTVGLVGEEVYNDPTSYKRFLAKLYAGYSLTGTRGADIAFIDEGFSQYVRGYWKMQELTTDEAVIGWNDQTIHDFHNHAWTSSDVFINATYNRFDYQIKVCNEFLRQSTDAKLNERGIAQSYRAEIADYRNEARLLRAFTYMHMIDMFGSFPIFTEESPVSYFLAAPSTTKELFDFVEKELLDVEKKLKDPRTNEYGRIDKAAAWMILSKLYLNSVQYIGVSKYAEAVTYADKTVKSGYELNDNYEELFMADNNTNGAEKEVIFPVVHDGIYTTSFGGTQFLVHASVGGSMLAGDYGIRGGWAGLRTTSAMVDKFSVNDKRALFFTTGQNKDIREITKFTDGYAVTKWTNKRSDGANSSNLDFVDTDFPMLRLGDAYLIYAEAVLRAGGNKATAVDLINQLRVRTGAASIKEDGLTLDFILDERSRELYWEGHRRTDLIRFGKYTGGSYLWPWKGGSASGVSTPSYRNLFPIPTTAITANTKLKQNPGY